MIVKLVILCEVKIIKVSRLFIIYKIEIEF